MQEFFKCLISLSLFFSFSAWSGLGEVAAIYVGEGPSINMALNPKLMSLKLPIQQAEEYLEAELAADAKGKVTVGMYYEVIGRHLLHVNDESQIPLALSAMLYQRFIIAIQAKTKKLGAIHPNDCLDIALRLHRLSSDKRTITKLNDCSDLLKHLRLKSSTVYSEAEIEAIRPIVCEGF